MQDGGGSGRHDPSSGESKHDMATTAPPTPAPVVEDAPVARRRRWISTLIGLGAFVLAAIVLILCITSWDRWIGARRYQETIDAYLQSDLTPIGARVAGYVRAVPAQDFETVRAGQVLVQIDDDDYRASYDQARANAAVAEAAIGNLTAQQALQRANIAAASASVQASNALALRARQAAARQRTLLRDGSGSEDQREATDATNASAAAQVQRDTALREAAIRQSGVLSAQIAQARASVAAARAAADLARINLRHARIVAPQDGVLGQRQVRPGQYVAVGAQLTTLMPLPRVWVIANFKETQMTYMRPGQRATITVDAYPGHVIRGHVSGYAPGTGSQFALLPPDNATGNFTKIVQRLAVKIAIDDPASIAPLLRPGMSVSATIDTGVH